MKDSDHETMKNLDKAAVSYQLVLTKTDRLNKSEVPRAIAAAEAAARKHGAAHPEVLPTSSETKFGIAELRAEIGGVSPQAEGMIATQQGKRGPRASRATLPSSRRPARCRSRSRRPSLRA